MLSRLLSSLLLVAALLGGANVCARDLPVRWQKANSSAEASAASVAALAKWHGRRVSRPCEVLGLLSGQRGRSCCNGPDCAELSLDDGDVQGVLQRQFGLQVRRIGRPLNESEIARQLDAGQPVIATINTPEGRRHALVIGLHSAGRVALVDPLAGQLLFELPELTRDHPGVRWESSIVAAPGEDPSRLLDSLGGMCRVERVRERYPEREWQWFEQNRTCFRFRCVGNDCQCTRWYQDSYWRAAPKWREHWVEREICD